MLFLSLVLHTTFWCLFFALPPNTSRPHWRSWWLIGSICMVFATWFAGDWLKGLRIKLLIHRYIKCLVDPSDW